MSASITPSQTAGPYHSIGMTWAEGRFVVAEGTPGAIWIRGRVTDGAGSPVPDGAVETWQADPAGRFPDRAPEAGEFRGIGRCLTGADGEFEILTMKPGRLEGDAEQAPHIDVFFHSRGLLKHLMTRIYFADEAEANAVDPALGSITDPTRRATLVAQLTADGYRFDIRLQGEGETVFFRV